MASTGQCPYCGAAVSSEEKNCPSCGAPNQNYVQNMPRTVFLPKTIDELKEYCAERGMPLLRMRFFIGEDFREPRAFGIYRDGSDFVVYKNKADGSRAIRYRGPDEAHAVNELFQKLLSECHNRGIYPDGKPAAGAGKTGKTISNRHLLILLILALCFTAFTNITNRIQHRSDGYYSYGSGMYYRYGTDWYFSNPNTVDNWYYVDDFPVDNYDDYYAGEDYDSDWTVGNFENSAMWDQIQSDNSFSSDDFDSWDSGGTDWDSDW